MEVVCFCGEKMTKVKQKIPKNSVECEECGEQVETSKAWRIGKGFKIVICEGCLIKLNPENAKSYGLDAMVKKHKEMQEEELNAKGVL